jgi:Cd2+/Zn2+-exporting ATPase
MSIRPDEATVLLDGVEEIVDAEDVEIGSTIIIRAGERVPIDSTVISGAADVDTSALTGESIPRAASVGSRVESGSVVMNGVITCRTERMADESAAARILELVENASENKSKEESFITKFSRFYTPIVVGLAVLMSLIPPLFKLMSWGDAIYSALNFLVISCPCALVISVPMAFFGGIGGAASKGILFKGGNVFSPLARADSFAFDKTGTLTNGSFKVSGVIPAPGVDPDTVVFLAASAEYGSNHPLAECVKSYATSTAIPAEYKEIPGRGVVAKIEGKVVLVGNADLLSESGISIPESSLSATLLVAADGEYKGQIIVTDDIKTEAESAISSLKALGAKRILMLSGDRRDNAERVGDTLGITDIHYELLPEEKYARLTEIIADSNATVYVGDGINDAPSITAADVGIAMGAIGSDSAIEAADVVIMSDSLDRLPTAVKIARKTVRIAKINIVFALAVKGAILVLSALGYANMWLSVFADVGVAVIAILNSIRTMKVRD